MELQWGCQHAIEPEPDNPGEVVILYPVVCVVA